ncbi:MAG: zinc ribbon domain-containing protein [Candidatus Zixiibacteriota bacterium]|nr:MAG: zinc ribbon domain-containing protein [candidate division Zixibacteria bacterium]
MPTYSYRCQACKHEFEEFQRITDLPVKECPKCGGLVMRVITGGAGLSFKGAGFYITDNRSSDYKKAANSDNSASISSSSPSTSPSPASDKPSKPSKD